MDINKESIDEIDKEIETEHVKKVEAALFIAGKFMSIPELVTLTDVNPILLRKILEDLGDRYKDSGIEIINQNEMWKMDVSREYIYMVNKLASGSAEFTKAEQETLAIIAYKQPMKQSIVIKIRGNKAYEHIKKFVGMGLVNKKKMGHTAELTLNENFHDYFHLDFENQGFQSYKQIAKANKEEKTEKERIEEKNGKNEKDEKEMKEGG